jgi:thioredoxin reductase (NADPH)
MEAHITEFFGDESLRGVKYKNLKTGEVFTKKIDGVFIFVGYEANTRDLQNGPVKLNQWNEVITDENLQTNLKGVFAAGDCRAKRFRQITTAVADGTIAALNALNFIQK